MGSAQQGTTQIKNHMQNIAQTANTSSNLPLDQIVLQEQVNRNIKKRSNQKILKPESLATQLKPALKKDKTEFKLKKIRQSKQNNEYFDDEIEQVTFKDEKQKAKIQSDKDQQILKKNAKTTPLIQYNDLELYNAQQRTKKCRISKML